MFAGQGTQLLVVWSAYVPAMHIAHVADPVWEIFKKIMKEGMEESKEFKDELKREERKID